MQRRRFLALLGSAPLTAAQFWERRVYPDWTAQDAERLLTESPWAQELTSRFEFGGPPSVRTEIHLTIRWSSALPIRQALALQEAAEVAPQPAEYIVEIFGFPAIMAKGGAARVQQDFEKSAALWWKGGRAIRATSVRVPEHGTHLAAELRFPRSAALTEEAGVLELSAQTGPVRIEPKFKLKPMVYQGRLEL